MRLERGTLYAVLCPDCAVVLTLGWEPDDAVVSTTDADDPAVRALVARAAPTMAARFPRAKVDRPAPLDAERMRRGPVTCNCDNLVRASIEPSTGRLIVEWEDPRRHPVVMSTAQHPPAVDDRPTPPPNRP